MDIFNLNISEFIKTFTSLTDEEKNKIIRNPDLKNMNPNYILTIFNVSNDEIKKLILIDSELTFMLLNSVMNKSSKLNCLSIDIQKNIISNPSVFLKFSKEELLNIFKYMDINIYKEAINNLNKYICDNDILTDNTLINDLKQLYNGFKEHKYSDRTVLRIMANIIKKYDVTNETEEPIFSDIIKKFCDGSRNFFELNRIETYEQLYIYDKFGIVVNEELLNQFNITIDNIKKLKIGNLNWIINNLKEKDSEFDDTKTLITAVKMYCLFGFDNCKKILDNKFTYSTDKSILRAAIFKYIVERRKNRINNPDDFLNYELITKLKNAVIQNDRISFMKHIVVENQEFKVTEFVELRERYKVCKNINEFTKEIKIKMKKEFDNQEKLKKFEYYKEYKNNNSLKRKSITPSELFELFKDFDIKLTEFDKYQNVVMNNELKQFLLGNTKNDNDCLLRLVLNKQGLDYNDELINIINIYPEIINKLKSNLKTKYSLLDVLDIYKTIQYQLNDDELEIPLSILTKVALSKKHLTVSEKEAIDIFKNIYKEARNKYYSTIPKVKGITKNGYKYKILDKNDIELATSGIDTGNCFKPGGGGQDFYKYCLTSPYADVLGIKDPLDNLYIVPLIRNGNGVFGNGLDPEFISNDKLSFLIEAIKECYNSIINQSDENEKIDFCTMSNLHNYIINSDGYKQFEFTKSPIIGKYFYTDMLKPEITNYVLCGDASKYKEFIPTHKYLIERKKPYVYSKEKTKDKIFIEQKLNEINYQSIDMLQINADEKNKLKNNKISIDDYIYVIGNDDWYIAINKEFDLKKALISLDPRADFEFNMELENIEKVNDDLSKRIR